MACGFNGAAKWLRPAMLPLLLALAWPGAASAQSCSLSLLNSVPLAVTKSSVVVPASIGGKERLFQLDTTAPDNQMDKNAVAYYGLGTAEFTPSNDGGAGGFSMTQQGGAIGLGSSGTVAQIGTSVYGSAGGDGGNGIAIYNARGVMFHTWAETDNFTLGTMQTGHLQFVVTDLPEPGSGGILSAGFFQKYDIDLDFAGHKFNMFSPDHCPGEVVYWRTPGVDKLPFRFRNGQITIRVTVDGRPMDAVINTGWPRSEMKFDDVDSAFYKRSNTLGVMREDNGMTSYNFGVLSFGTVAIRQPHLVLTHSVTQRGIDSGPVTGTLLRNIGHTADQPELLIGADLLQRLHVYISFKEKTVYVTQASELPEGSPDAMPVSVKVTPRRP